MTMKDLDGGYFKLLKKETDKYSIENGNIFHSCGLVELILWK